MNQSELKDMAAESLFTPEDWTLRKQCISMLRTFDNASIAAGKALNVVREKKLFLPHKSLKEFCERECGWTRQRGYQLMSAAKVVESLPAKCQQLLTSEGAARELSSVPETQREEVLQEASNDGKVTAKSIREAAKRSGASPTARSQSENGKVDVDALGLAIPPKAQPYWDRRGEVQAILTEISRLKSTLGEFTREDPMWREVNLNGVIGELGSAYNQVKGALPAYVCPYCQGANPAKCTACKGRGVVSKHLWDVAVPVEIKKMREKAAKSK